MRGAFTLPFCTPPHASPPFSMQWWCVDAVVVITGGWCVAKKKRNIHTEDTTSHREKKKKKKKKVPSIELANFDWIVLWFHPLRYSGMNSERAFTLPFCTPPHVPPPLFDAVVVCRCSGCDYRWVVCRRKKRNIYTEDTTSHGENKKDKKKRKKKKRAEYRTREL